MTGPVIRSFFAQDACTCHLFGDACIEVANEPEAFVINYALSADAEGDATMTLMDAPGRAVRRVTAPARRGLNGALVMRVGTTGRGRGGGTSIADLEGRGVSVTLEVNGQKLTRPARVRARLPQP